MAKTTKKKNKISIFDVVNLIAMILVGLIMLMPILNLVAKAFSSEGNVIAGKVLFWPLGLSIVKHGAMFHHARVSLESEPNKGTTVRVTF